jgi:signal peptidase I
LTFIGVLPSDSGDDLVKRVIGVAGDRVACCDAEGRIVVNGVPLDEDYIIGRTDQVRFDVTVPPASMFAWAPLPPALKEMGSLEFSKQLLTHAKVAVAPGVGYGEDGEGYVRIAMVENEQRIRQAARNVRKFLQMHGVNTPSVAAG